MTRSRIAYFVAILGFAVSVSLISTSPVRAADSPVTDDNLMERLDTAKTPADHQALAAYFHDKANAARRQVKTHQAMLAGQIGKGHSAWHAHCSRLIKAYKEQAADYDALAAMQEKWAKQAGAQP